MQPRNSTIEVERVLQDPDGRRAASACLDSSDTEALAHRRSVAASGTASALLEAHAHALTGLLDQALASATAHLLKKKHDRGCLCFDDRLRTLSAELRLKAAEASLI